MTQRSDSETLIQFLPLTFNSSSIFTHWIYGDSTKVAAFKYYQATTKPSGLLVRFFVLTSRPRQCTWNRDTGECCTVTLLPICVAHGAEVLYTLQLIDVVISHMNISQDHLHITLVIL